MGRLRDDIEAAKAAFEKDVKTQNMEIANLKDCLLEVKHKIFYQFQFDIFFLFLIFRLDELQKVKKFILNN